MKLTIARKLIISFLGLTLIVLIATLGLARWSFDRGFLDYVNALEQKRLQVYAERVAQLYIDAGNSWGDVNDQQLLRIIHETAPEDFNPDFPPPLGGAPMSKRPPPESGPSGPPPKNRGGPPPTSLYDVNGNHLAGELIDPELDMIIIPVHIGDEIIGDLRSTPRRQFSTAQETAFSKQQFYTSGIIGLISLSLALIVSYILTRLLLRPIRHLVRGVSALSNGDFSKRLDENRNDELGLLMNDLDQLAITLEENQRSRKRWLADISHELRTPVTVLTGEIEMMKDGIRPIDLQQILSLDQEVLRLRHLIDDLYELSISDIGGLRYNFQPTDVQELIHRQVESLQTSANEIGLKITINTPEKTGLIKADAVRLDQLFSNLISNSIHYTDAPGMLIINVAETASELVMTFSDSPPGVSSADCEKLFDPLYRQESSRSRRTAGAGLGLAICKNIVDAHRGRMSATPSEHGGLKMTLSFPLIER